MNNNNGGPFTVILTACAVIATGVLLWYVLSSVPQQTARQIPQQQNLPPNYPLNMEITSYIGKPELDAAFVAEGMGDKLISFLHKVTFDNDKRVYVYDYKISFIGKEKCFFSWELLDRVLGEQSTVLVDQPPQKSNSKLVELEPNKVKEFKLTSDKPPVLYEGVAWIYKQKKDDKTVWELIRVNAQAGPLPRQ